tara:strand:- start:1251 stop:1634 length:384 start_codon:yes stop_codon:yes gene_type:complete
MSQESITLVLPLPHNCLSPNARVSWQVKAGITKKARRLAKEAVRAEEVCTAPWGKVEAQEAFFYKTNRHRDERNSVAMLKAYYDGVVDAGLIQDDNHHILTHGQPTFQVDATDPRVEITITSTSNPS